MILPQEFPRHLAQLRLEDVLADLPDEQARQAYLAAFEARRADPQGAGGVVLVGRGTDDAGLRLLMALMRLMVLRFRDLNMERFEAEGGEGRLLSAYVRGENLALPLPDRAAALFVERADRAEAGLAGALRTWDRPLFATWEGPTRGPLWEAIAGRCTSISI